MLGKVMDGQVCALSQYGYRFDDAQEKILRFGTEAGRAAVLVDVISANIGGMYEAVAHYRIITYCQNTAPAIIGKYKKNETAMRVMELLNIWFTGLCSGSDCLTFRMPPDEEDTFNAFFKRVNTYVYYQAREKGLL
jgi:hypothetical protein